MDRFKARFVRVWNDPVWSKVISGLILAILGAIGVGLSQLGKWLMSIEWGAWITPLVNFLAQVLSYPVPLWYIGMGGVAYFGLQRLRKWMTALTQTVTRTVTKTLRPKADAEASGLCIITDGKVSTKILEQESGTIAVWAKVTDAHNKLYPIRRHLYIIAHAGNNGLKLGNPHMAKYPNAWAIERVAPTGSMPNGLWRFYCNGMRKDQVIISTEEIHSSGWRLFTVEWSKPSNFIRLHIDGDQIGESQFAHWPEDVTGDFALGTWARDAVTFRFNSDIGPVITQPNELRPGQLDELLRGRPTA